MISFSIAGLVHQIASKMRTWEVSQRAYLSYRFNLEPSPEYPAFLTVCIDNYCAVFTVKDNTVEIDLGFVNNSPQSSESVEVLGLIVSSIGRQIMSPLLGADITTMVPILLFPRLVRCFFDDLDYLLELTHPHSLMLIADVDDPLRPPMLLTSPQLMVK